MLTFLTCETGTMPQNREDRIAQSCLAILIDLQYSESQQRLCLAQTIVSIPGKERLSMFNSHMPPPLGTSVESAQEFTTLIRSSEMHTPFY
jgi:hypothetical protein